MVEQDAGQWGTARQRDGAQAQQETNGLRRPILAANIKSNGTEEGDEAPIEQSHDEGEDQQPNEHVAKREEHCRHPNRKERDLLQEDTIDFGQIGNVAEQQSTQARGDANADNRQFAIVVGECLIHELIHVHVGHKVTEQGDGNHHGPDHVALIPPD